jgi:hypothetical protein
MGIMALRLPAFFEYQAVALKPPISAHSASGVVLCRADITERGVTTFPVVKNLNVFEHILPSVVPCRVALPMCAFVLHAVEETLHRRIDAPMSS